MSPLLLTNNMINEWYKQGQPIGEEIRLIKIDLKFK